MKVCAALLMAAALPALAGGIERLGPDLSILFEEGRYAELSFGFAFADWSGTNPAAVGGGETGNIGEDFAVFGAGFKTDIGDRFSLALILDQPLGVDVAYTGGFYDGTNADLNTYQLTLLGAVEVAPGVKLFAGPRVERIDAEANVTFFAPLGFSDYNIVADPHFGFGFAAGASYERPEIALRASLTYFSEIEHAIDTTESFTVGGVRQTTSTTTNADTPQAIQFDFQTGIAPKTLLFGQVRWVDWDAYDITPPSFNQFTGQSLADIEDDTWTYTLGLGRQLTDRLAGSIAFSFEAPEGTAGEQATLGPYDGRQAVRVGLQYQMDRVRIEGGIRYTQLGDAVNGIGTDYDDNSIWSAGLSIGFRL